VDKPEACTSHDIVAQIRKIFKGQSVGHAGTLDPMATGLLVLLLGEATKLSSFLLNEEKGYTARVQLGVETDTFDRTGQVLKESPCCLSEDQIRAMAESLKGPMELKVPVFSAVKVKGKKLYEEARKGHAVEAPIKTMDFYELETLEVGSNWVELNLKCSKGSYIRSWAHLLGEKLKVGGHLSSLRRTWSSPFHLKQAVTVETLKNQPWEQLAAAIPLEQLLSHWPSFYVEDRDLVLVSNGQLSYGLKGRLRPFYQRVLDLKTGVKIISKPTRQLVALLEPAPISGEFKIGRVFHRR